MSPYFKMQNDDTKTHKTHKTHLCEKCKFGCFNKKDYNRHLLTAKHKMMTNVMHNGDKKTPKPPTALNCLCGKSYAFRQGLDRHKKTCSLCRGRCPPTTPSLRPQAELYSKSIVIPENTEEKPSMMDFIAQSKEIVDILVLQNKEMVLQNKELTRQNKEHSDTIHELILKIGNNNHNNKV
jgi:hypothetical protein